MDEHVEAVQRMQDYIATHLDINITMADLAKVSQYSPWYSYRLFMDLLHMTPAVYIRRQRLSKSALQLRDEKVKINDIAFDAGFDSVFWKDSGEINMSEVYSITEGYRVGFSRQTALLEENFPNPVIQMEIDFHNVPWVLENENSYK